jgi:hypothetical protein
MEELEEGAPTEATPPGTGNPAETPPPTGEHPGDLVDTTAQDRRNRTQIAIVAAGVVLILIILGLAFYGAVSLVTQPSDIAADVISVMSDVSIIVLALVSIVIGAFLVVLIYQLQSLTVLLRGEIKPILESANRTANTVRGTTTFVSDAVVNPAIAAASYFSGVARGLRLLFGLNRPPKSRKSRPQPGSEPQTAGTPSPEQEVPESTGQT